MNRLGQDSRHAPAWGNPPCIFAHYPEKINHEFLHRYKKPEEEPITLEQNL